MNKVSFIFPGQGAQYVGMGKTIYDSYEQAKEIYNNAEKVLGIQLKRISFEGPEEELRESKNAQVAILVHSYAIYSILRPVIEPDIVAGHSLGEYTALVACEAINFADALHLTRLRGELMSRAGEKSPGTMAAIIGLSTEDVKSICKGLEGEGVINPANYNSLTQTVITGEVPLVHKTMEIAKEKGARRVIELKVSGAFHSKLMEEAFVPFKKVLLKQEFRNPKIPIVMNVTGDIIKNERDIRNAITQQILNPVQWVKTLFTLETVGVNTFIEIGPGKILSGLVKRTIKDATTHSINDADSLNNFKEEVK
ncbi:MAG: ACP S-malonyltransferase [Candidatus Cloacimonadota bacterium]|nr:MAG: ACP S-malonyltransferase [Candidatus Cloacimonadota bacterium]